MTKNGTEAHVKQTELKISMAALFVSIIATLVSQVRPLHEFFETPDHLRLSVASNLEVVTWQQLVPTPWATGIGGRSFRPRAASVRGIGLVGSAPAERASVSPRRNGLAFVVDAEIATH